MSVGSGTEWGWGLQQDGPGVGTRCVREGQQVFLLGKRKNTPCPGAGMAGMEVRAPVIYDPNEQVLEVAPWDSQQEKK